jgi:hypothetical protein
MMKLLLLAAAAMPASASHSKPFQTPVPASFESRGADRQAIETLLANYTKAVSTKNQRLFETLLLSKAIPFSGVPFSGPAEGNGPQTGNYEGFRNAVFEGAPFTQRFQNVHIDQDGPLAQVSLVFVNTTESGSSWGWKTMQLVKIGTTWRIAAEFFTGHG